MSAYQDNMAAVQDRLLSTLKDSAANVLNEDGSLKTPQDIVKANAAMDGPDQSTS